MKYFLPSSLDSIKGWYPLSRELSVGRQKPENQPTGGQNGANQIARARGAKEEENFSARRSSGRWRRRVLLLRGGVFFQDIGERLFVTETLEMAISCIVSLELTFTFWRGKRPKFIQNHFSLVEHVIMARWQKHVMQKNKTWGFILFCLEGLRK